MLALPTAPILTIFLLSGLLRATACALFLPRIKEVRAVKRIKHRELVFRIAQFRAFSGSTFSLVEGATLNTGPGLVQAKDKKSTDTSK